MRFPAFTVFVPDDDNPLTKEELVVREMEEDLLDGRVAPAGIVLCTGLDGTSGLSSFLYTNLETQQRESCRAIRTCWGRWYYRDMRGTARDLPPSRPWGH